MLSWTSIWAIVLRHARMYRKDLNLMLTVFYWPLLDIMTWGFLGAWIGKSAFSEFHNYETTALMGVLLWQVIGRGCNILCLALTEELWSNNVVNLFSTPLRISEWMCGAVIFSALIMGATTGICMLLIALLYDVSLWYILSSFLIFLPPLFLSGLWLGFTALQITITLGKRGAELGFVILWFLLPFSGAYYPLDILPAWGQSIGAVLPMTPVFCGMRGYLMHDQDPTPYLIKGYILGTIYALLALAGFIYCFNRSKNKGLARLAD